MLLQMHDIFLALKNCVCYNRHMKHIYEQKVYYADTDSYGVTWHGTYLRWLEAGRVELCEMLGLNLKKLMEQDILIPVVNLSIRYKMSARLDDTVVIETEISKFNGLTVTFKQSIKSKETGKVYVLADVDGVAISYATGRLYKKMPELLSKAFEKELKCLQPV